MVVTNRIKKLAEEIWRLDTATYDPTISSEERHQNFLQLEKFINENIKSEAEIFEIEEYLAEVVHPRSKPIT